MPADGDKFAVRHFIIHSAMLATNDRDALKFAPRSADRWAVRVAAAVLTAAFSILNAVTLIYCVWSALRSPKSTPEQEQRALGRSLSWPTHEGDAFKSPSLSEAHAEPTIVSGQVTD